MVGKGPEERVIDFDRLRRSCRECSLRTLCLPAGIERGDLEALDHMVRPRMPLERGEALFRAGDGFEHLFVVRSGTLRTAQTGRDGEEQVLGFHLPGELVGLEGISEDRHLCDALALERTSVCAIPFARLEDVAQRVPGLQRRLHRLISQEFLKDQQHVTALGRRTARERLALFLAGYARRLEASGHDGRRFDLAMSRDDIANYLGLALETVSRVLTRLQDDGVLAVERRHLEILDLQALACAAGVDDVTGRGAVDSPGHESAS